MLQPLSCCPGSLHPGSADRRNQGPGPFGTTCFADAPLPEQTGILFQPSSSHSFRLCHLVQESTLCPAQDVLQGSPDATLKSLGICNGDALWVLSGGPPIRQPFQVPESNSEEAPVPRQEVKRTEAAELAPLPGDQDTRMQDREPWNDLEAAASPLDALAFLVHAALLDCGLHLVQASSAGSHPWLISYI